MSNYIETPEIDAKLSDSVYYTDSRNQKRGVINPAKAKGHEISFVTNGEKKIYRVLKPNGNDKISGFQAMAVAPVTKDGTDTSRITIAYAGTNVKSIGDVATDGTDVLGGVDATGQWNDAKKFADKIHTKYPNAKISVTGHSLGGFLVLELLNHWPTSRFLANEEF